MDNSLSESARFAVYREKLKGICEANNLSYVFIKNAYPIKLVIRPLGGVGEQMSMLEEATEDNYISPGASILFTVKDGNLTYRMSKTFTIDRECLAHAVGQVSVLDGEQDGCARRDVVVLGRFFQHRHLLTNAAQRTDNQLDGICVLDEHIAQVVGLADALEFFTVDCETCGFRQRIIHDEAPFK